MEIVCGTGSDLRALYAGFSAKGAVLAALMAEKGLSGMDSLFEGEYGFFRTYFDGRYDGPKCWKGSARTIWAAGHSTSAGPQSVQHTAI